MDLLKVAEAGIVAVPPSGRGNEELGIIRGYGKLRIDEKLGKELTVSTRRVPRTWHIVLGCVNGMRVQGCRDAGHSLYF